MDARMGLTVGMVLLAATACAPDEELVHPCLEGSGMYTNCELVEPGGGCTDDEQCKGELAECVDGKCECVPDCEGKNCGDDGCAGNCGKCGDGLECGNDQACLAPCAGKECGDDGYGGLCGICETGSLCQDGMCQHIYWIDPVSGLTWQGTPTGGNMNWSDAKSHCAGLSLDGGGWYLPTIGELRSLMRGCPGTVTGGACDVTDACLDSSCNDEGGCTDCSHNDGPADGCYWPDEMQGTCSWYWSSSPVEDYDSLAWYVGFDYGNVYYTSDFLGKLVRCVR